MLLVPLSLHPSSSFSFATHATAHPCSSAARARQYNHTFENTDVVDLDELDLAEDHGRPAAYLKKDASDGGQGHCKARRESARQKSNGSQRAAGAQRLCSPAVEIERGEERRSGGERSTFVPLAARLSLSLSLSLSLLVVRVCFSLSPLPPSLSSLSTILDAKHAGQSGSELTDPAVPLRPQPAHLPPPPPPMSSAGLLKAVPGPRFGVLGEGPRSQRRHHRRQALGCDDNSAAPAARAHDAEPPLAYFWDEDSGGSEAEEVDDEDAAEADEAEAAAAAAAALAAAAATDNGDRRDASPQSDILCQDDGGACTPCAHPAKLHPRRPLTLVPLPCARARAF